jgi:hypothetical protein
MIHQIGKPLQFGLASVFGVTTAAAAVAALPAAAALFVLLVLGYAACASGWIIDLAAAMVSVLVKHSRGSD